MEDYQEISHLKKAFVFSCKCLYFVGILKVRNANWGWKLWSYICVSVCIVLSTLAMTFNLLSTRDFMDFIERISVLFACYVFLVKLLNYKFNETLILKTMKALGDAEYYNDGYMTRIHAKCDYYTKRFILASLGFVLYMNLHTYLFESKLIYTLFVEIQNPLYLFLGSMLELLQTVALIIINISIDVINYSCLYVFEAHLECLSRKFRKITSPRNHLDEHQNVQKLKEIIADYNDIVRVFGMIHNCFIYANFVALSMIKLLICTVAFQLSNIEFQREPLLFIRTFWFLWTELTALSVPHYFSDRLTSKSARLLTDCFECSWVDQNMEFKRLVLLYSIKLKKPLTLNISNIFELNLEEFVKVCNATYSLYALLKQFKKD